MPGCDIVVVVVVMAFANSAVPVFHVHNLFDFSTVFDVNSLDSIGTIIGSGNPIVAMNQTQTLLRQRSRPVDIR